MEFGGGFDVWDVGRNLGDGCKLKQAFTEEDWQMMKIESWAADTNGQLQEEMGIQLYSGTETDQLEQSWAWVLEMLSNPQAALWLSSAYCDSLFP